MHLPVLNERAAASPLPPLYAAWIDDLLQGPIPPETQATCDDCVMCKPAGADDSGAPPVGYWFNEITKCCTYVPRIPNYLVGRILRDTDPRMAPGVASTRKRLEEGVAVTPLGLGRGSDFHVIYGSDPDVFGRHIALRCPHQRDDGMCGVWLHRSAVCATWFCKHSRGAAGRRFWDAILHLLEEVERELSVWCVLEVGLEERALNRLLNHREMTSNDHGRASSAADSKRWRQTWGSWGDRKTAFFEACAERVESMSWSDVLARTGPYVRSAARLASQTFKDYSSSRISSHLKCGSYHVSGADAERAIITTYNRYDPIELPLGMLQLLPRFDGRATDQVVKEIETEYGVQIEADLIARLVDFGILQPA